MFKQILKGALLGAIIVFVWSAISWMLLPWHGKTLNEFKNEEFVGWVIDENAPQKGMYVIPYPQKMKMEDTKHYEKSKKPFILASVSTYKRSNMMGPIPFIIAFITQFVGAGLISYLLMKTRNMGYCSKVCFVTIVGLIAGVLCYVPEWNWWHFSLGFTLVNMADVVIGWFLAGLLMAKVVKTPMDAPTAPPQQ